MTIIADDYAQVLFDMSLPKTIVTDSYNTLKNNEVLRVALDNPTIARAEKHRVIEKLFDSSIVHFVEILCDNNRMDMYEEIYEDYYRLVLNSENKLEATYYCVHAPQQTELDSIKAMLVKRYDKAEAIVRVEKQPELIGGFVLKVGDIEYNKSIKGALDRLKQNLNGGEQGEY